MDKKDKDEYAMAADVPDATVPLVTVDDARSLLFQEECFQRLRLYHIDQTYKSLR